MPSRSKSQARLFQAAAHGADFAKAREIRASMPMSTIRDFAVGPMAGKPEHVKAKAGGHPHKNLGAYLNKAKAR